MLQARFNGKIREKYTNKKFSRDSFFFRDFIKNYPIKTMQGIFLYKQIQKKFYRHDKNIKNSFSDKPSEKTCS